MRRDLKDRVGGSIDDQGIISHLLLAKFHQNLRAGSRFVADKLMAGARGELVHELFGEAGVGEGLEGGFGIDAHHLPVPRHRVFAIARLAAAEGKSMRVVVDGFDAHDVIEFP